MKLVFIGEQRSNRARQMDVRWRDGRLAASTLFDALRAAGLDPGRAEFVNLFERGGEQAVREAVARGCVAVGMGRRVQAELALLGIDHVPLVHPAARGAIRRRENYRAHVAEALAPLRGAA